MANEKTDRKAASQPRRRKVQRRWLRRVALGLLLVVVVFVGAFAWNRWFRFDDARDIQGEWRFASAPKTIVIDGAAMKLTQDVAYTYTLDPWMKTITFSFDKLKGEGLYAFSEDRKTLVIVEGRAPDVRSVLGIVDFSHNPSGEDAAASGEANAALSGRSVFTKMSDATDVSPQSLANNATRDANTVGAAIVAGEGAPQRSDEVTYPAVIDPEEEVPAREQQDDSLDRASAVDEAAMPPSASSATSGEDAL
ncbi:MAG: hypothetical protein RSC18_04640 [Raoultibacter sp.]